MTLWEYVHVLRSNWQIVASGLMLGVAIATFVTIVRPPEYSATATVFISARPDLTDPQSAFYAQQLAITRMTTYTALARSSQIAGEAAAQIGSGESVDQLSGRVVARFHADTSLLTITATGSSPERATRMANSVTERLLAHIDKLERDANRGLPIATGQIFQGAELSVLQMSPRPFFNFILGVVLGAVLGFVAALAIQKAGDQRLLLNKVAPA
jgi:capsular polysaccharide biosynthesis protein